MISSGSSYISVATMDQTNGTSSTSITKLKGKESHPAWCTKLKALLDKLDPFDHIEVSAASKHVKSEARDNWLKADREPRLRSFSFCRMTSLILFRAKAIAREAWFLLQEEPPDIVLTKGLPWPRRVALRVHGDSKNSSTR